ncbi:MAG: hypothetical protein ACOYMA_03540 [Bacteroidia bacterium]
MISTQQKQASSLVFKYISSSIVLLLLTINLKAQVVANDYKLLPVNQIKSDSFKTLVGNNRLQLFNELKLLVNNTESTVANNIQSNLVGAKPTTIAELVFLLGEPNLIIQNSKYQYNLVSSVSACKATFMFNKDGFVKFCVVTNCP